MSCNFRQRRNIVGRLHDIPLSNAISQLSCLAPDVTSRAGVASWSVGELSKNRGTGSMVS